MSRPGPIKVLVRRVSYSAQLEAIVYKDIGAQPDRLVDRLVLAQNGKWREKSPMDQILDDEKFNVDVVEVLG